MLVKVKALVSLNIKGRHLKYAGRGYQPNADFPRGEIIGTPVPGSGDHYLEVETPEGKKYLVAHEDVTDVEE